jgi:hypothetical protein
MYDAVFKLSPNRSLTRERFLLCENAVIATAGDRTYLADEVAGVEPDANKKVTLNRPKEVLFAPETLASFEGKPVTLLHPDSKVVDPQNWQEVAVGNIMNVRQGTGADSNNLLADILIFDADAIAAVQSGKYECLSAGFRSDAVDVGGGRGVETSFVGNHVAIVPEGRSAACVLADAKPQEESMEEIKQEAEVSTDKEKTDEQAQSIEALADLVQAQEARIAKLEEALAGLTPAEAPEAEADAAPEPEKEEPAEEEPKEEAPAVDIDELADKVAEKLEAKKAEAEEAAKADACIKNDAADIAPSVSADTPNLALAAVTEFAKTAEGKAFVDGLGGIKNDAAPALLKACASFVRAKGKATVQAVKNDAAPVRPMTFAEKARNLWK